MSVNSDQFVRDYANKMAPLSQRQMPVYSHVGKGLRGDSAAFIYDGEGSSAIIHALYYNQMTDQVEEFWNLPVIDLVPKLHYEVWRGVRNIDGELWWGYYIKYRCDFTINSVAETVWAFETPFAITSEFQGENIPPDEKIDSDEE